MEGLFALGILYLIYSWLERRERRKAAKSDSRNWTDEDWRRYREEIQKQIDEYNRTWKTP